MRVQSGLRRLAAAFLPVLLSACGGGSSAPVGGGDQSPPSISVSGASHGESVQGVLPLSAAATDAVGVDDVVLYIDNRPITSGPGASLAYSFDTTKRKDGWVAVTFGAEDSAGNWGWQSMAVWVGNQTPTPDSPPPVVEPPVIVPNPDPAPAPDPEPVPPPPPPPGPPVLEDPGTTGEGTVESPIHIRASVDYTEFDPTYPYIMFLGLSIGEKVWGRRHFEVITSDDKGVQHIELYHGHEKLAEADAAVLEYEIKSSDYEDGSFPLQVYSYDGDLHYITEFACWIDNSSEHELPELEITDYDANMAGDRSLAVSGTYNLHAETEDESGIKAFELFINDELLVNKSGSGRLSLDYPIDTLNWPGYDPNQVCHTYYPPEDEFHIRVAIHSTDNAGNMKAQSFRVWFRNRMAADGNLDDQRTGYYADGGRLWLDATRPGSNPAEEERIEAYLGEQWGYYEFETGIPVGQWTMHYQKGTEDVSFPVVVTPEKGLRMAGGELYIYIPAP